EKVLEFLRLLTDPHVVKVNGIQLVILRCSLPPAISGCCIEGVQLKIAYASLKGRANSEVRMRNKFRGIICDPDRRDHARYGEAGFREKLERRKRIGYLSIELHLIGTEIGRASCRERGESYRI